MNLAGLQDLFQDRLLTGGSGLTDHLADGGRFMAVYDHAYRARLVEVLEEDFPATRALMGHTAFSQAARSYVQVHPSTRRSIRWIGMHFTRWLTDPALSDLAAFEWALGLAFDAPDAQGLTREDLAALDPSMWPALSFRLHPSLSVVLLTWDIVLYRQGSPPSPTPPSRLDPACAMAVWRDQRDLSVRYRPLDDDEAAALQCVRKGGNFAEMCDCVADIIGTAAAGMRAAALLATWLADGWLVGLELDGASLGEGG